MNRKRIIVAALVLAIFLNALGFFIIPMLTRSKINKDNFERIRIGMSEEEVDAILGGPERDETNGDYAGARFDRYIKASTGWSDPRWKRWVSKNGSIDVQFDEQRQVCYRDFQEVRYVGWTLYQRAKMFLGL
jgi:hypothetical protein